MNLNFFLLLILPQCAFSAQQQQQQLSIKHIFILAGQSNMAGRGGIIVINHTTHIWDGIVPQASRPNPSVFRLDASLQWVQAAEPLHAGIDTGKNGGAKGVGPGMAFANALLAHYSPGGFGTIGLVPCAMGGTSIRQWEKGTSLYARMVSRVLPAVSGGGEVSALLWYQGESDTIVGSDAESYGRRLVKLFGDIRMDLMSPMLPIIQVGLASGEGRFVEKVREAQFGIDMLNLRTVDAKGLSLRSDKFI